MPTPTGRREAIPPGPPLPGRRGRLLSAAENEEGAARWVQRPDGARDVSLARRPRDPALRSRRAPQSRGAEVLAWTGEGAEDEAREPWNPRKGALPDPT